MQIAPGIGSPDWQRLDLNQEPDWQRGITIFEQRIRGRFTDAAGLLITDDDQRTAIERRWGFAILAIDCFLVKTLQAFRKGLTNTKGKSRELCVKFLTERA